MKSTALRLVIFSVAALFIGEAQYAYAAPDTNVAPTTSQGPEPDTATKNSPTANTGPDQQKMKHHKKKRLNSKKDTTKDSATPVSTTTPGADPGTKGTQPSGDNGAATNNTSSSVK